MPCDALASWRQWSRDILETESKCLLPQVICSDATLAAANKALQAGQSTWRVSSTVFAHMASDQTLRPLGGFDSPEARQQYPEVLVGHQVEQELSALNLKA